MADEALYYGTGRRKNAVARVRLVPGTGKVTINGRDGQEYFGREALFNYAMTPFKVTDTTGHFDVKARIDGGGVSGQAGALRHGISRALLEAGDYRAELKKAGYLTRDARMVERKKYGLKKARKRPQFSKRYVWSRASFIGAAAILQPKARCPQRAFLCPDTFAMGGKASRGGAEGVVKTF